MVLICWFLEIRRRLTSWPKRCNSLCACLFIARLSEWFYQRYTPVWSSCWGGKIDRFVSIFPRWRAPGFDEKRVLQGIERWNKEWSEKEKEIQEWSQEFYNRPDTRELLGSKKCDKRLLVYK